MMIGECVLPVRACVLAIDEKEHTSVVTGIQGSVRCVDGDAILTAAKDHLLLGIGQGEAFPGTKDGRATGSERCGKSVIACDDSIDRHNNDQINPSVE